MIGAGVGVDCTGEVDRRTAKLRREMRLNEGDLKSATKTSTVKKYVLHFPNPKTVWPYTTDTFQPVPVADLGRPPSIVSSAVFSDLIRPLHAPRQMRRVCLDVARVARGTVASSSSSSVYRVPDVPSTAVSRFGFATAGQGTRDAKRTPLSRFVSEASLLKRSISSSSVPRAPRAGSRPAKTTGASSVTNAELERFVTKCCEDIGRGGDHETVRSVVAALRVMGNTSVASLDAIDETNAMAAGVPLRLAGAMRRRMQGSAVSAERRMDVTKETSRLKTHTTGEAVYVDAVQTRVAGEETRLETSNRSLEQSDPCVDAALDVKHADVRVNTQTEAATKTPSMDNHSSLKHRGLMIRTTRVVDKTTRGSSQRVRVQKRLQNNAYRLGADEMCDSLKAEFVKFRRFLTTRRLGSHEAPVREVTAKKYEDQLRGLLGWMRLEFPDEYPSEKLTSLTVAFPSSKKKAAKLAFEHLQWLSETRKCSAAYELVALRAFIAAAKFTHGGEDFDEEESDADRPYANVPLVRQLRALNKDTGRRASKASPTSEIKKKWLNWAEYLSVVKTLEHEVAPRFSGGGLRSDASVAWSLQRYLIFGILACVPDRQRTIRELEVGKTLFKEYIGSGAIGEDPVNQDPRSNLEDDLWTGGREGAEARTTSALEEMEGTPQSSSRRIDMRTSHTEYPYRWVIKHGVDDYKTGKNYGERPPMVIAPQLYGALEEWLGIRRAHLAPKHNVRICISQIPTTFAHM